MEVSESSASPNSCSETQIDHQQSSDCITDKFGDLSLHPENDSKVDTDNNGYPDVAESEEREKEEALQEEEKRKSSNEGVNLFESEKGDENAGGSGKERQIEGGGDDEREKSRRIQFPVRPDVEDCAFYLRTGSCKFGMNCKFNHPPNRKSQGGKVKGKEESFDSAPQRLKEKDDSKAEQIDCKYFDRPGGCKFGKACKFNHSRKPAPLVELNFMGLPIRLGEKECPYYMHNGSCKFGANCKFNHPDPTTLGGSDNRSGQSNGGSILSPNATQSTLGSWSPAALSESPPYVPLMFPPTQPVPSPPEWHAYQAPVYSPERSLQVAPAYAPNSQLLERNAYKHQQQQILVDEFPERPGQPECSYFLKTGNCKYRSACKFHHPKSESAKPSSYTLNESGLPLRPGQSVCSYYSRYGICKFGPACKYDHSINYASSTPNCGQDMDENSAFGDSTENDRAMTPASTGTGGENLIHQSV